MVNSVVYGVHVLHRSLRVQISILPTYNLQLLVGLQQRVPPRVQQRSPPTFLVLHENSHFLVELLPTHRGVLMCAPGHFLPQLDKRLRFPLPRSCPTGIHASHRTRGQANQLARSKQTKASARTTNVGSPARP